MLAIEKSNVASQSCMEYSDSSRHNIHLDRVCIYRVEHRVETDNPWHTFHDCGCSQGPSESHHANRTSIDNYEIKSQQEKIV